MKKLGTLLLLTGMLSLGACQARKAEDVDASGTTSQDVLNDNTAVDAAETASSAPDSIKVIAPDSASYK